MNTQLAPEQIDHLFAICEKYEVNYYDVQIELVDHMACKIEELLKINPKTTFEEALFMVLKEFGVDPLFQATYHSLLPSPFPKFSSDSPSAFEELKKSKEQELNKKYSRLQIKYLADFFKIPRIILTIAQILVVYFILQHSSNNSTTSLWIVGVYSVILLLFLFVFYPESLRLKPVSGKSFLLFKHYKEKKWQTLISLWGVLNLLSLFINHENDMNIQVSNFLFASFFSFFIIVSIVMAIYIPRRIKEDFINEYPQFVKD